MSLSAPWLVHIATTEDNSSYVINKATDIRGKKKFTMRRRQLTNHRKSTLYNSLGRLESEQETERKNDGWIQMDSNFFFTDQSAPDHRYRCILILGGGSVMQCSFWLCNCNVSVLGSQQLYLDHSPSLSGMELRSTWLVQMWRMTTVAAPPGSSVLSYTPLRFSNMGRFTTTSVQAAGWVSQRSVLWL